MDISSLSDDFAAGSFSMRGDDAARYQIRPTPKPMQPAEFPFPPRMNILGIRAKTGNPGDPGFPRATSRRHHG
jgi:hypothetical protein